MSRPTLHELAQRRERAASLYWPEGNHIRHEKTGNIYEIMFYSTRESDAEVLITFRPIAYDDKPRHTMIGKYACDERDAFITRPLSELKDYVIEGDYQGARFRRVIKEGWVLAE